MDSMLTVVLLGLMALALIVLVPQTLGYCVSLSEERDKKIKTVNYWDGDNWFYGAMLMIGMAICFMVVFFLGLIACICLGIDPILDLKFYDKRLILQTLGEHV